MRRSGVRRGLTAVLIVVAMVGVAAPAGADGEPVPEFGVDGVVIDQVAPAGSTVDTRAVAEDLAGNTYVLFAAFPGGTAAGTGGVAKYTPQGIRDTSFGSGGIVTVDPYLYQLLVHRSGALVMGGVGPGARLQTMNANGSGLRVIDPGLPGDATAPGRGAGPIVDLGDGRLLAVGNYLPYALIVQPDLSVTRIDRPPGPPLAVTGDAIVLSDGSIVYMTYQVRGTTTPAVCRMVSLRADLSVNTEFGSIAVGESCPALLAMPDGTFLVRDNLATSFEWRSATGAVIGTVPRPSITTNVAIEGTGRLVTLASGGESPEFPLVLDAYWPDGTPDPFIDTSVSLPGTARPFAMPFGDIVVIGGSFGDGTLFIARLQSVFGGVGPQWPAVPLSTFTPTSPERILDTRLGLGAPRAIVPGGRAIDVQVTGRAGVPAGAVAVVLNVTATEAVAPGYVTVWPAGTARPVVSSLNLDRVGQTAANLVTLQLPPSGALSMFSMAGTHLVADVLGYYVEAADAVSAGRFQPVAPERILDTREGNGAPLAPVPSGGQLDLQVRGRGGVPDTGVSAVVLNVTATNTAGPGFFTVWPTGRERPTASNLNVERGETRPNLVIVPVGVDGKVSLFSQSGADLIADVAGWFTDDTQPAAIDGMFSPLSPRRIMDSRYGTGSPIPGAATTRLQVGATTVAPPGFVGAPVLNVTATDTSQPGFVTIWQHGGTRPTVSNLNVFRPGQVVPNAAIIGIPTDEAIDLYNQAPLSLVVDLFGYYLLD